MLHLVHRLETAVHANGPYMLVRAGAAWIRVYVDPREGPRTPVVDLRAMLGPSRLDEPTQPAVQRTVGPAGRLRA